MKDEYTYKEHAVNIYTSMAGVYSDVDRIIKTIKLLKTQDEWESLIAAFGVRSSLSSFINFRGTLPEWLSDDLDNTEYDIVHKHLVKIGARPAENKKPDTLIQVIVRRIFKIQ